ncbi:hypothetical protein, partial [Xanthomonas nasturtii]
QKADDLLVSKTLLHVQSPSGRELDSKLRRYSKSGGRRLQIWQQPLRLLPKRRGGRQRLTYGAAPSCDKAMLYQKCDA